MRVLPHDLAAERALVGMLLVDGARVLEQADGVITDADCYATSHQTIWRAALAVHTRGHAVDMLTVRSELDRRGELSAVGGDEYLLGLSDSLSASDAETLCRIVRDHSQRRTLIAVCHEQAAQAYGSEIETTELIEQTEARVFGVRREDSDGGLLPARQSLVAFWERAKAVNAAGGLLGVRTGIGSLDGMIGGLWDGELTVVAGRPSMGKTAMLETLAINATHRIGPDERVLFFSAEMASAVLWPRIIAKMVDVSANYVRSLKDDRSGNEIAADALRAIDDAARLPIHLDDTSSIQIGQLRSRARRVAARHRVRLVCVDYVQIIRASKKHDRRDLEIGEVVRALKVLARELACPVVVGAQIKREVAGRADRRPTIADIRESGFIEEAADTILMLHREPYYNQNAQDKGQAEIIVGKNRNGETGTAPARYVAHRCMFAGDSSHG